MKNDSENSPEKAPVDPSNTSSIGQKVEQDVIDIKSGISEQSGEWEDNDERNIPVENFDETKSKTILKKPSPEEINFNEEDI